MFGIPETGYREASEFEIQEMILNTLTFEPRQNKIACIKWVRESTNMGLKHAKDFVEAVWRVRDTVTMIQTGNDRMHHPDIDTHVCSIANCWYAHDLENRHI